MVKKKLKRQPAVVMKTYGQPSEKVTKLKKLDPNWAPTKYGHKNKVVARVRALYADLSKLIRKDANHIVYKYHVINAISEHLNVAKTTVYYWAHGLRRVAVEPLKKKTVQPEVKYLKAEIINEML